MFATAPDCATLTVEEAAQVLGISRTTMYALVRSNLIPHLRFGRVLRLPKRALDEWLVSTAQATVRGEADEV